MIGAGLLMTGCSSTDPAATAACTQLADARNGLATAVHNFTGDRSADNSRETRDRLLALSIAAPAARDAAPAALRAVFTQASDSVGVVVDNTNGTSETLQAAFQASGIAVGSALLACVHAGVSVQTVDQATGQTSQMSG